MKYFTAFYFFLYTHVLCYGAVQLFVQRRFMVSQKVYSYQFETWFIASHVGGYALNIGVLYSLNHADRMINFI